MTIDEREPPDLKRLILLDARDFLISLQAGASYEYLATRLIEIGRKEAELITKERLMLSPYLWRILINRFMHGNSSEIINAY